MYLCAYANVQDKNDDEQEEEDSEAEIADADNSNKKKFSDGNPALHWLFRKIAYIARKPGNDERVSTALKKR